MILHLKTKIVTKYCGLFLNTLHIIAKSDKELELVNAIFRLRLLSIIGFQPIIGGCSNCNTNKNLVSFSLKNDGFKCEECSKQDKSAITISETTKDAIKYIVLADSKKLYSFEVPDASKKELEIVSKVYLTEKLEKNYIL